MKTKKFDYEKWGAEYLCYIETQQRVTKAKIKDYSFWADREHNLRHPGCLDGIKRTAEQWRRIYYEAKKRERGEKNKPMEIENLKHEKIGEKHCIIKFEIGDWNYETLAEIEFWNYIDKLQKRQCNLFPSGKCPYI